jgi:dipeptidyl aminopeptidase/acylaminoacyl peptidase
VIAVEGGEHRWVSEGLDRNFEPYGATRPPVWLDPDTLLGAAEDRGETHLYRLRADGPGVPERVTSGPISVQHYDVGAGRLVTAQARVERPAEIVDGDALLTSVTRSLLGWERFTVPFADGSEEIDAWLMRPDGFTEGGRYPVLFNVHGGPFTQYGETFFDEAQMQAAAGFVVVMCNPRGSSGRHTGWGHAINGPKQELAPGTGWGSVDVDDIVAVLDAALARYGFCDPDRVGMLGGSYGGYMATLLAGRTGTRFRAICSERSANNLLSMEWSSDFASAFRTIHGVDIVEDEQEYVQRSPVNLAAAIDVPLLLLHSEDDLRCPIGQAEELFVRLRLIGKDVTFYRFPGEGHELSRSGSPVHRRMRAEIILDFFAERLRSR